MVTFTVHFEDISSIRLRSLWPASVMGDGSRQGGKSVIETQGVSAHGLLLLLGYRCTRLRLVLDRRTIS